MGLYRKKPVVIEAWCVGSEPPPPWAEEAITAGTVTLAKYNTQFSVETLEGRMVGRRCDYLVKGVRGELYPCERSIFQETYEEAT